MENEEVEQQMPLLNRELDQTPIYPVIHMIREDICHYVDAPLTYEAMLGPDLTYSLTLPLQEKYLSLQSTGNPSIVFSLLLNRVYFLRDTSFSTKALSETRAMLAEILAIRILRENETLLDLAIVMTTSWPVWSGASDAVKRLAKEERVAGINGNIYDDGDGGDGGGRGNDDGGPEERVGNAIEIAILGQAKKFIKSSACQKVINGIWSGKIVYQAESTHSILSDTYKRAPVHYYDPHKAPLLDHYRLKVPAIRSVLEYINFLLLFVLFVVALEFSDVDQLTVAEGVFMLYALGFCLEKLAAMQEHGIRVYITGTYNGFDMLFVTVFMVYIILRISGIYWSEAWARNSGMDCLAIVAVLIFPRLAFATLSSNLMVLALRSMIIEFAFLMSIAAFCFAGFLYALWTLIKNKDPSYSASQIAWWMLDLWFGLDASGFDRAGRFHPFFGPLLMVLYACLSNTLLLTVLVSILSYTFSTISADAAAEAMYRRAVYTIEGVKADAIFSYQPPLNLFALAFMLPSSYILNARWFHKVNVFMIRLTNFPILLAIAVYERQTRHTRATTFYEACTDLAERAVESLPLPIRRLSIFEGIFGQGGEIDAIFEIEDEINGGTAVDTSGEAAEGPSTPMKRRVSSNSHRHRSHSPRSSFTRSPTQKPKFDSSSPTSPRTQAHAHQSEGQSQMQFPALPTSPSHSQSPLAQLYQGMAEIPEIDISPSNENDGFQVQPQRSPPAPPPPPIMARRRRLSSLGMLYRGIELPRTQAPAPASQANQTSSTSTAPPSGVNSVPFSQSPDHLSPSTVMEVESHEETQQPNDVKVLQRLQKVEESQAKIEGLLTQLLEKMSK